MLWCTQSFLALLLFLLEFILGPSGSRAGVMGRNGKVGSVDWSLSRIGMKSLILSGILSLPSLFCCIIPPIQSSLITISVITVTCNYGWDMNLQIEQVVLVVVRG